MKSVERLKKHSDFRWAEGLSGGRYRFAGTFGHLGIASVLFGALTLTWSFTARAAEDSTPAPAASSEGASGLASFSPTPTSLGLLTKEPAPSPSTNTPAPYSLPWQLRPIVAPTVIRSDTSIAAYENAASTGGTTIVTSVLAAYKIPGTGGPSVGLSPVARLTMINDSPPAGNGGLAVVNPLVGAGYAMKFGGGFRANFFLGVTLPVGMGGGDAPDPGVANSRSKGVLARSAMDNALFAVNDLTVIPGVGIAYVAHGLTVQAEATLLQLTRVRGDKVQQEASKTNFTSGIHVGYFVASLVSLSAELRYQRWINAPFVVEKDTTDTLVDNLTVGVGPRFHFKLGDSMWIRPGIAYSRGLDKPMAAAAPNYHILQIDVPVLF